MSTNQQSGLAGLRNNNNNLLKYIVYLNMIDIEVQAADIITVKDFIEICLEKFKQEN